MQRVNQFSRAIEVVHIPRLGTQHANKLFLLDNEPSPAPLAGEVYPAALRQLTRFVKIDARFTEFPPPEDVKAREIRDFTRKPVAQNLPDRLIGGNLAYIVKKAISTNDFSFIVHDLLVFAEDFNG